MKKLTKKDKAIIVDALRDAIQYRDMCKDEFLFEEDIIDTEFVQLAIEQHDKYKENYYHVLNLVYNDWAEG